MFMSGSIELGEKIAIIEIKHNNEKIKRPKKSLVEEGLDAKHKKVKLVPFNNKSNIIEKEGIRVDESVKSVRRERRCKTEKENSLVAARLFDHLSPKYSNSEELRSKLKRRLGKFDTGNHTFHVKNHIILVSRDSASTNIAVTDVSKKAFASGGFGNLYAVKVLESSGKNTMALKLSRKNFDNIQMEIRAKESIEHELKIIDYIRNATNNLEGLNVEVYGNVSFNHQLGYFVKRFDCDGLGFLNKYQPQSPAVKYGFMLPISRGWKTMRKLNLVHRDIKLDNTLVTLNGKHFDVVLTDFGNTINLDHIFIQKPYPSVKHVFGCATKCFISEKYRNQVKDGLKNLKKFKQEDKEYIDIANNVKKILIKNDKFAMAVSFYTLWMEKDPSFKSFEEGKYFCFNEGATEAKKLKTIKHMKQELTSVSKHFSKDKFNNGKQIVVDIMNPMIDGLESSASPF